MIDTEDIVDSEHFLERAQAFFARKLEDRIPDDFPRFVAQYFHLYPLEELVGHHWNDLFGCVYQWWSFIQEHDLTRPKVRVFNPNLEEHGWLSNHTVVAILQRDMPFLVDSVRIEFNRRNIAIHTVKSTILSIRRDRGNCLTVLNGGEKTDGEAFDKEALLFLEINRNSDEAELADIRRGITSVLREVEVAVEVYPRLLERARGAMDNLRSAGDALDDIELPRSLDFLRWMTDGHYTFLAYHQFDLLERDGGEVLVEDVSQRLGTATLDEDKPAGEISLDGPFPGPRRFYDSPALLDFAKASERARVHRSAYPDYVIIKRFDESGRIIGEGRFVGLYTSPVYYRTPAIVPIIRDKVDYVIDKSGWDPNSHDGKMLWQVLETFPRDELFQSTADELYQVAIKVAQINERYRVRLFMRRGAYGQFVSCMVYVPRDLFSTAVRIKVQNIIAEAVGASEHEFNTYFSESILARVHLVFKVDPAKPRDYDVSRLEQRIINVVRSWEDHLFDSLVENHGEEQGSRYFAEFKHAFPTAYQEHYDARNAVHDIQIFAALRARGDIAQSFYQPVGARERSLRFKIFRLDDALELSEVIPILEHLGLRVIGEQPFKIRRTMDGRERAVWLHDFELEYDLPVAVDARGARDHFQEAFAAIWHGQADSDPFNRLVLGARLNWREVVVLRAYAAYLKQTQFNFSQGYIASTLAAHLDITRNLVALFKACFDPRLKRREKDDRRISRIEEKIRKGLDRVENLNEDTIIRRYLALINGSLRTNFFRTDPAGESRDYLSIKFAPRRIPGISEPRPFFEIFVYSPRVEGVHLRGGKVARGGLRWSDRLEDYRTEVMGLVKAQQVKNAVIVPEGAKGGFVAKQAHGEMGREAAHKEGVACYEIFVRGLLDITDNLVEKQPTAPPQVVRRDEDDPYLVVAADKGTATFSDLANSIAREYQFWLGDAFASGGSQGYDHKKMGITARGAWVSVQRHFRERDVDIQSQDFTVVGIGDMGGDVFGNGMLLSRHIQLVAAFNHLHIFIDPDPDPEASFAERERLFGLAKSAWPDYNEKRISRGGGVFSRSAKSIPVSAEMRRRFDTDAQQLTPAELIQALLRAPVDLVWNGGIGTYVKAAGESHGQVGDKSNDNLRVNGSELRCKVFGEGGNLGMTQLGRVEYAMAGGACNTDFIDNAAGVDCSDHEVNIKILLNELVAQGDLTEKQRNRLLEEMTEDVAHLVLANNYRQVQAISLAREEARQGMGEFRRFIQGMEHAGHLDRELEFLPEDELLVERQGKKQPLTRPELAVLLSYAKAVLKERLFSPELADDTATARALERPFPERLVKQYRAQLEEHRLRHEIVATQLANDMVDNVGITFCHRLCETTGSNELQVAKAYVAARDIYGFNDFRGQVEALDLVVSSQLQWQLLESLRQRLRRATRWFLRNRRGALQPGREIERFQPVIRKIQAALPEVLCGAVHEEWQRDYQELMAQGVPADLASGAALPVNLYNALGMVEASHQSRSEPLHAAEAYFRLADRIDLHWFAAQIGRVKVENYWQAMAREAFMDDLESLVRMLAVAALRLRSNDDTVAQGVETLLDRQAGLVQRWRAMVAELQTAPGTDFAMFSVALRELLDLAQASQY